MTYEDAIDIIKSVGYIDVEYNGKTVWIEGLNKDESFAYIKEFDSDKSYTVPLNGLNATDKKLDSIDLK